MQVMEREITVYFSEWEDTSVNVPPEGFGCCVTYPVLVSRDRAESSHGLPVVVIDDEARGNGEMPPGELQVPARWAPLLLEAGYALQIMDEAEMERLYEQAPPVSGHWHPGAHYIRY